ncbi:MAG: T9SS type A sorting domain-containing protein [Ignavibacteria bacterium]
MKKKNIYFLALVVVTFIAFHSNTYSQLPSTLWAKVYTGPANLENLSNGICLNASGMVFVTGTSNGVGTGLDIVTIRYNPATGDTIWVNRYNGNNQDDRVNAITCDNSAVYVTGWSLTPSRDIITIKYDALTGTRLWVKTYNGTGNGGDYGFAIAVDALGNVYSTGRSDVGGSQKFTTIKYDAAGNVAVGWPSIYTGPLSSALDEAHAIKVDLLGNVYVTGKSGAGTTITDDYLTVKMNSGGAVQWGKEYNGNQNGEDNAVALVLDGAGTNVYVAGYSTRTGQTQDYVVIKYLTLTGDSNASAIYGNTAAGQDFLTSMTIDALNNIYVTGYSQSLTTSLDYATIKYNSSLAQQWVQRNSAAGADYAFSVAVDNVTGHVYVTGGSTGTGLDYLTISYSNNGTFNWEKRENGPMNANDLASGVAVGDTERIFVTGSAIFTGSNTSYYTLRYSAFNGIEPISGEVPTSFSLMQNFPNPFNPSTAIRFDIPKASFVSIVVYDIMGREVEVLANENARAGKYEVKWNASVYSSGIYFYTLRTGDFSQTKKMILTK